MRSVSPQYARRSEWPRITCETPRLEQHRRADLAGERALQLPMHVLRAERDARRSVEHGAAAASAVNGGATTISTCSAATTSRPAGRTRRKMRRVSAAVLCIFQLPATIGVHYGIRQRGDAGQRLPLEELQRRAAAGRDVRHASRETQHVRGRRSVAAADDADRAGASRARDRLADDLRACAIRRLFVDAHRAVEDDRLRASRIAPAYAARRFRADVEDHLVADVVDRTRRAPRSSASNEVETTASTGRCERRRLAPATSREIALCRIEIVVAQRSSDVDAGRGEKRVGHAAADAERVDEFERDASKTPILSLIFAPPIAQTNGFAGRSIRRASAASSASMRNPAALGSRCATPSVEACARCAVPNASLT